MSKLTEDFDLLAIAVLALMLGVVRAPQWDIRTIGMELRGSEFRILHVDRAIHTISIPR
jgi:hypothetical protein